MTGQHDRSRRIGPRSAPGCALPRRAALRALGAAAWIGSGAHAQDAASPLRATIIGEPAIVAPDSRPRTLIAPERRAVALTFDDGPTPDVTLEILAALRVRAVKATFFMVGRRAAMWPELVRAVIDDGHEIASHAHSHVHLAALDDQRFRTEVDDAAAALAAIAGRVPAWFRPPYGELTDTQRDWLLRHGWSIAFWSVDPADWSQPLPQIIAERVTSHARHGAVVLLHDLHRQTVAAVPLFLEALAAANLTALTLSQVYPD